MKKNLLPTGEADQTLDVSPSTFCRWNRLSVLPATRHLVSGYRQILTDAGHEHRDRIWRTRAARP